VWSIDRQLQEEGTRPIIFYYSAATCRQPEVKGLTIMVNSIYNGWRMEDVWLDR
jgi:peptide/nickel transport system substrate-binding protein